MSELEKTPEPELGAATVPTRMLRREQQLGYVLAGVAAAAAVSVGTFGHNLPLAGAGLATAVVFLLAVRKGHRIMTAIGGFLAAVVMSYSLPLELAMLLFSGYLMMRTSNGQAKARRAQGPVTPAQRRQAAADRAAAKARRRKGVVVEQTVVKSPPPNRRYTPPKPKPARPPQARPPQANTKGPGGKGAS